MLFGFSWEIFWSVLAAFVLGNILLQLISVTFGTWYVRRIQKKYEENLKNMMDSGEVDPSMFDRMPGMEGMPMGMQMDPSMMGGKRTPTTVSGEEVNGEGHGQYL